MFPSTTLSGVLPAMKSSNDGPSSRVEVKVGLVGAEAGVAVANERMAILHDRCRSNCWSEAGIVNAILIPLRDHSTRDTTGTRLVTKQSEGGSNDGVFGSRAPHARPA